MYHIQSNLSGTRSIDVALEHLQTIQRYHLFDHLVDSNGIIDESVLDKLKFNIRSMLSTEAGKDKQLLDLCLDVIYHNNMKAYGLSKLIDLYQQWSKKHPETTDTPPTETE
ncbi:MAG: hypothetical protein J5682_01640 [Prevotella sp.]|nr:hypothetical protein [Prevotella sp.]